MAMVGGSIQWTSNPSLHDKIVLNRPYRTVVLCVSGSYCNNANSVTDGFRFLPYPLQSL